MENNKQSSFHCAECQEAHFSITHDSQLKMGMLKLKRMVDNDRYKRCDMPRNRYKKVNLSNG